MPGGHDRWVPPQQLARNPSIEQYRQFRPEVPEDGPDAPYVTGVSWEDATAFCRWLSEKEGKPCRLPTEALPARFPSDGEGGTSVMIHLVSSMNHPSLHFEMNEA